MIKKYLQIVLIVFLNLAPLISNAEVISEPSRNIAQATGTAGNQFEFISETTKRFNAYFMETLTDQLMENGAIGWRSGGLVKQIFLICFVIAMLQALANKSHNGMVNEMAKLAFRAWLIMALLGGPTYQKLDIFHVPDQASYPQGTSLDLDIYNWFKYQMDKLSEVMFSAAGPSELLKSVERQDVFSANMINAKIYCAESDINCIKEFINSPVEIDIKEWKLKHQDEIAKQEESGGILSKAVSAAIPQDIIDGVRKAFLYLSNLNLLFFYLIQWAAALIRAVINMFALISFGITTALALFILKLFLPFAVLSKYSGRVMQAAKIPLSTALYGFATSLIVYISAAGMMALNEANTKVIISYFNSGNMAMLPFAMPTLSLISIAGSLIFVIMQLLAIMKVPKLSKDIMNLSLDSLVEFGKEMVTLGLSMAPLIAGAIATGGFSMLGGALGGIGGAVGGAVNRLGGMMGISSGGAGNAGAFFQGMKKGPGSSGGSKSLVSGIEAATGDASGGIKSVNQLATEVATKESVISGDKKVEPIKIGRSQENKESASSESKQERSQRVNSQDYQMSRDDAKSELAKIEDNKVSSKAEKFGSVVQKLASAGIALGHGKTSEFKNMMMDGVESSVDKTTSNITSKSKETGDFLNDSGAWIGDRKSFNEKAQKENELRAIAGLSPKETFALEKAAQAFSGSKLQPGTEKTKTIQNSLAAMNKDAMTRGESRDLSSISSDYNNGKQISPSQIGMLSSIYNNKNLDDAQKAQAEDILNKNLTDSLNRIKQNQADQSDYETAYKSRNLGYTSSENKDLFEEIYDNKEVDQTGKLKYDDLHKYFSEQNDQNLKLTNSLREESLDSKKGMELLKQISERSSTGLYNKDEYRENFGNKASEFNKKLDSNTVQSTESLVADYKKAKTWEEKQEISNKLKDIYDQRSSAFAGKQELLTEMRLINSDINDLYSKEMNQTISKLSKEGSLRNGDIRKEINGEKIEIGFNKNNELEKEFFIKNNNIETDFSLINEEMINQLNSEKERVQSALNDAKNGNLELAANKKKQYEGYISRIDQFIEHYNNIKKKN